MLILKFLVLAAVPTVALALAIASLRRGEREICRACYRPFRHVHVCSAPTLVGYCLDCDVRREITTSGSCVACGSTSTMHVEVVA